MSWMHSISQRYRVSEDPLRTLRRMEMVALLLVLLLCLQLAFGGFGLAAMTGPEPVQPAADSLHVPQVYGPAVVAAEERNEIITRPLFWAGRQPESEVVVLPEDDEAKAGNLKGIKLVGVFGSGERAGIIALVKDKKRRILVGESIDGWTLESVDPGEIQLGNGDQRETLTLQQGKIKKAEPAPPAVNDAARKPSAKPAAGAEKQVAKPAAKAAAKPARTQGLGLGPR